MHVDLCYCLCVFWMTVHMGKLTLKAYFHRCGRFTKVLPVLGKERLMWGMTFEIKFMAIDNSKEATDWKEIYWFTAIFPAWKNYSK